MICSISPSPSVRALGSLTSIFSTDSDEVTSVTGSPGAEVTCSGVILSLLGASVDFVETSGPDVVTETSEVTDGGVSDPVSSFGRDLEGGLVDFANLAAVVLSDLECPWMIVGLGLLDRVFDVGDGIAGR